MLVLTPDELEQVRTVLARYLPPGVRVGVFESRAGGSPKPWSDLDLVLDGQGPLPLVVLATLAEAFDESALPWKVDLIDRHLVTDAFGAIIDAGAVALFPPEQSSI